MEHRTGPFGATFLAASSRAWVTSAREPPRLKVGLAPVVLAPARLVATAGVIVALAAVAVLAGRAAIGYEEVAAEAPLRPTVRLDDLVFAQGAGVWQEALRVARLQSKDEVRGGGAVDAVHVAVAVVPAPLAAGVHTPRADRVRACGVNSRNSTRGLDALSGSIRKIPSESKNDESGLAVVLKLPEKPLQYIF